MTEEQFKSFIDSNLPDNHYLAILWYDAHNEWGRAHQLADSKNDQDSAWLHAYLHRKEGDEWNARYWYKRASKPFPGSTLQEEWKKLYNYFFNKIN